MTAFISAGHNPKGIKVDPGAVGNGYTEADLAVEFRNLVVSELLKRKVKVITDSDDERLADYLKRIQTGSGSVVLEFHFDAAVSSAATGTTALIGNDADRLDKGFAKELVESTSTILGIKNRGVLSEKDSRRGSLGLMREQGIVSLLELCFISNPDDLKKYHVNKKVLAIKIAEVVERYENML
ncbi:N-acetylmuramoyl-L-alanine amidase [Flavobacterium sp. 1355]|uniref:N-acetylmuramoyl-L-alanine amidase n=1 Tax=Flavobacterium sp. 1355 TaxID=2806571 RepID=UPI001AE7D890|nr:N-acetylmuramoyl-L-alanine amidase [Flavobacterium sp. 1355]MBP1222671.1 N-acetylmuramoyl-L-alanine amidase [Flavobacterium sp. 1355]